MLPATNQPTNAPGERAKRRVRRTIGGGLEEGEARDRRTRTHTCAGRGEGGRIGPQGGGGNVEQQEQGSQSHGASSGGVEGFDSAPLRAGLCWVSSLVGGRESERKRGLFAFGPAWGAAQHRAQRVREVSLGGQRGHGPHTSATPRPSRLGDVFPHGRVGSDEMMARHWSRPCAAQELPYEFLFPSQICSSADVILHRKQAE
jgi:hypothetical protein